MQRISLVTILVALVGLTACSGCGAPKAKAIDGDVAEAIKEPVEKPAEAPEAAEVDEPDVAEQAPAGFDHSSYGELLAAHVDEGAGRVDYAALKPKEAELDAYLATLAEADLKTLSRDEQLALLLNAYNAYTLKLILENYGEIESIRDLKDPWGTKRYQVAGDTLSLDDIEHGLIRPLFKDPRIHFAVNCAAIGCPPLADEPFLGDTVQTQLDEVTKSALSNPRYAKVEGGKLHLTKIMEWYGEDFTKEGWEPTARSLPEWVAPRSTEEVRAYVEKGGRKVTFVEYDWSLNDVE